MHSILIIGCGSIGERHLRCFRNTGRCVVAACDTNPKLLEAMEKGYGVAVFRSLDEALEKGRYDAAVICTPAHLHLPIALKLLPLGLHLFIEKPLAIDTALVPEVRAAMAKAEARVAVAYVYHLMPWISGAREYLLKGELGKVLHVSSSSGQHFPTYRPAYRDIYYAKHEQGGGAIQDALTHIVNAVEWLIGPCTRVYCDAAHQALEGVTVEDTVNVSARHGEVLVSYALTQFQAPNENTLLIHCEHGSVKIEIHERRWGFMKHGEAGWTWDVTPPLERDELFTAQASAFMDEMEGMATPLATFEEAVQTLKFNQAALRSAASGQAVEIS
ncbi:Gfo/Idh/MocA family protein [Prosthecobacter sp.]|uniref:Gfo/Idh/MocA family protein n=1 Tax=Prosthecobacter sp. TaxID=1965333 RepID=UPI003784B782